jgi:hypothetical protein
MKFDADEVKFNRLLDRNVAWLCPSENLVDKFSGTPEQVLEVRSIRHHPPTSM